MPDFAGLARRINDTVHEGHSLQTDNLPPLDREILSGTLRHYFELAAILDALLSKPLADKHSQVEALLLAGLYSVRYLKRPAHASVNECVSATGKLRRAWAKGLVNGVLRSHERQREQLDSALSADREAASNHPAWLIDALEAAWAGQAEDVIAANNARAPMTLRVNTSRISREAYLAMLASAGIEAHPGSLGTPTSLVLAEPVAATGLPGFSDGLVSVQDEASQVAAALLDPAPGERILDACAAPGGKTCHLLEYCPDATVIANDIDEDRLQRVADNCARLKLDATLAVGPLAELDVGTFDRILLDAPCSATGIIRRHPDIKLLRRSTDIAKLAGTQRALLDAAWDRLNVGGKLLYSTCSVLPTENEEVINQFMTEHPNAHCETLSLPGGNPTPHGWQLLPAEHDGFFYALLTRQANPDDTA